MDPFHLAQGDEDATWALPKWDQYSESGRASHGSTGWSDVEADVSFDTSSVTSTQHQRIYRQQREQRPLSELQELHLEYVRRRNEEYKGETMTPRRKYREKAEYVVEMGRRDDTEYEELRRLQRKPLGSLVRDKTKNLQQPIRETNNAETQAIMSQQTQINEQLQAVRQQLVEFQQKWKATADTSSAITNNTLSTIEQENVPPTSSADGEIDKKQSADGLHDDAIRQWILLIAQKVNMLTSAYSHGPTQDYNSAMSHLSGIRDTKSTIYGQSDKHSSDFQLKSWHVGCSLKNMVPHETAERFMDLEKEIACLHSAIEQSTQRQLTNFEKAVRQVQEYHHERLQRVVDESLEELKQVRGKYKKKQNEFEEEIRTANQFRDEWKLKATEIEHQSRLERETMEYQLAVSKKQYERATKDYEEDITRLKEKLETARVEVEDITSKFTEASGAIDRKDEEVQKLQARCKDVLAQHNRMQENHEKEVRILKEGMEKLEQSRDQARAQVEEEKVKLSKLIQALKEKRQLELKEIEARVKAEVESNFQQTILPVQIKAVQSRLEREVEEFKRKYEQKFIEQAAEIAPDTVKTSLRDVETQTNGNKDVLQVAIATCEEVPKALSDERVNELSKRCRALENLLDKKFEETSRSLSSSRLCASCHSEKSSTSSDIARVTASLNAVKDSGFRAKVAAKLSSSRTSLEDALFTDETTLATTEMWDTASFTSIDSNDDMSPFLRPPRPQSHYSSPTDDVLALVRKLERSSTARSRSRREPEAELSPSVKTGIMMTSSVETSSPCSSQGKFKLNSNPRWRP